MQLNYTWLPADTPDSSKTLQIHKAQGVNLITHDNKQIYDAISSWWCKPLGHSHPLVKQSILEQLEKFEHHIPAKAWNPTIERLSTLLVNIFTTMEKVVYASDGSSAIEIAMKLSYESRVLNQQAQRNKFVALNNAYHGETIFTLSVCGIAEYKRNFNALLNDNYFIEHITYVNDSSDTLWNDCQFDELYWDNYFATIAPSTSALIYEPILQGAAGMKIISRDFLYRLSLMARKHDIHIIADEIMVGLGRLGVLSVSKSIIGIEPDIVCFAKNLTAGSIPMSAVVVGKSICDTYRKYNKAFYHSHTHSCNALAANVACHYLEYLLNSDLLVKIQQSEKLLLDIMVKFKNKYDFIQQIRVCGSIAAIEINPTIYQQISIHEIAIKHAIYLRNIGNVLYIMLPLHNIVESILAIEPLIENVLSEINSSN